MAVFCTGLLTLTVAFLIHILIWRIRRPTRAPIVLFLIFMGILSVILGCIALMDPSTKSDYFVSTSLEYAYVALFHISMTLAYLLAFTGIEAESPSSLIVIALEANGERGMSREELSKVITNDLFVTDRLEGLMRGSTVQLRNGRYYITPGGERYLAFFLAYRKLMGHMPEGG